MPSTRYWAKLLLWAHLLLCFVWLTLFCTQEMPPGWMWQLMFWSILCVQFTWGFTVGLLVGPRRKRRPLLWWSLLTVFYPLYFFSWIVRIILLGAGPFWALFWLATFVVILACETFGGVLLGAKIHSPFST